MTCASCGAELKPVSDTPMRRHDDWTTQYENALAIRFSGGYGMWADPSDELVSSYAYQRHTAVICRTCADDLVRANPWMIRWIDEDMVAEAFRR